MTQEGLLFEDLISDLSEVLSDVPLPDVPHKIPWALDLIRHSFGSDCCRLMEVRADRKQIQTVNVSLGDGAGRMARFMPTVFGFPWVFRRLVEKRQPLAFPSLEKLPPEANGERDFWENSGIEAMLMIPLHFRGEVTHLMGLANTGNGREWPENYPRRLRLLGEMIVEALIHRSDREALLTRERELAVAFSEIKNLKEQLQPKNKHLREEKISENGFKDIIGVSDPLK